MDVDGNFVIGPTHTPAFEMVVHEGVPRGTVHTFTMRSVDSKLFPGIARDSGTFGTVSPTDPATLVVTTSHPAPYTRTVAVYVPAQYILGTSAPFIVCADGPDQSLFTALDNLIAVLAYSITAINQQWPHSDETPHGAWEFHERLIPNSPVKPIRVWMEVGDRDFLNPNVMRDGMHDWVVASENMARVLAAKGYHYQFVFARNAGHVDRSVKQQTLPDALEWLWRGYAMD